MKKIKFLIAGLFSAIALVFACVVGTRVKAEDKDKWNHILTDTTTNSYITFSFNGSLSNISSNNASTYDWQGVEGQSFTKYLKMSKTSTASSSSGVVTITSSVDWDATLLFAQGKTTKTGCTITSTSGTVGGETSKGTNYANFVATITGATDSTVTLYNASDKDLYLYAIAFTYEKPADGKQTVTYTLNGGELPTGIDESSMVDQGTIIDLPTCTKGGYLFTGWTCSVDNENYTDEDTFTVGNTNVTFTANWTKDSSQWCTITFDSNGGSTIESTEQIKNTVYTLPSCTKTGYYLTGWSDENDTYSSSYTVPNSSSVTLTAQWNEIISMTKECELSSSTNVTNSNFISIATTEGDPSFQSGKGTAFFNGKNFASTDKGLKFDAKPTLTFTLNKASTVYLVFSTNYSGKKVSFDAALYTESFTIPSDGVVTLKLAKGSHTIRRGDAEVYLFYIGVVEIDDTASAVTPTLLKQFDDDDNPTKLRLIAKIEGLAYDKYSSISSVKIEFDFNNGHKTGYCNSLYKSVATINDTLGADSEGKTMYAVLNINGVSNHKGETLSNIKMTVTYSDGSSETVSHADITIPNTATQQ